MQAKEIPVTEPFAYPYQNIPYISHEWLSDLLFYGIYSLTGLSGMIVASATILATAFYLLFRYSVERFGLRTFAAIIPFSDWSRYHLYSLDCATTPFIDADACHLAHND